MTAYSLGLSCSETCFLFDLCALTVNLSMITCLTLCISMICSIVLTRLKVDESTPQKVKFKNLKNKSWQHVFKDFML